MFLQLYRILLIDTQSLVVYNAMFANTFEETYS